MSCEIDKTPYVIPMPSKLALRECKTEGEEIATVIEMSREGYVVKESFTVNHWLFFWKRTKFIIFSKNQDITIYP